RRRTWRTARSTSARILVAGGCAPPVHPPAVPRSVAAREHRVHRHGERRHGRGDARADRRPLQHAHRFRPHRDPPWAYGWTAGGRAAAPSRSPERSFASTEHAWTPLGCLLPWRRGPGHEHPAWRAWGRRAAEYDHAGFERGRLDLDPAGCAG